MEPFWEPPASLPASMTLSVTAAPTAIPVTWWVVPDVVLGDMEQGGPDNAGAAVGPDGPQEHLNRSWQGHSFFSFRLFCGTDSLEFNLIKIIWQDLTLTQEFQRIICV